MAANDFASHSGQIGLALVDLLRDEQPDGLADEQIRLREDWLDGNGSPYDGVSIVYAGEQYSEGTIGTSDIGYLYSIVLAKRRTADAELPDDRLMQWYEAIRRRLQDQRTLVILTDSTAPREHVCIVMPGRTLTDRNKWPEYLLRMLVVAVWIRENVISY